MPKSITRIVLTGGPAAGKTTLISRILKECRQEDGWKVITIPETATELISGFGIRPFGNCVSMEDFQYFVIEDQLHKERLALKGAEMVPEDKVLIIDAGRIAQYDTPYRIVHAPAGDFIRSFILRQLAIKRDNIFRLFALDPAKAAELVATPGASVVPVPGR